MGLPRPSCAALVVVADDALDPSEDLQRVEVRTGLTHCGDVDPVLRAIEHDLAHGQVFRAQDRNRRGCNRNSPNLGGNGIMERVVVEERIDGVGAEKSSVSVVGVGLAASGVLLGAPLTRSTLV